MMNLSTQFEVIIASLLFGILLMIIYEFINRFMYYKKGKLIRLVVETICFLLMSLLFFIIMLKISYARLNIFIPVFIFLGIIIYLFLLQTHFQYAFNYIFSFLTKKVNNKKLVIKAKFDIIKMKLRKALNKRYEKSSKSKKKNNQKK